MYLPTSRMAVSVLLVILIAGCSNITEQEITFNAGLFAVSPEDFSIIAEFPEVSSPRCLMIYPGRIFAASTEGRVYSFDAETYSLTDSYIVGTGSPAGYQRMVFSPSENSAYLIGATGKILELSMPSCEVTDEFQVGISPIDLAVTSGIPGHLWVIDSYSNSLRAVKLKDNAALGSYSMPDIVSMNRIEAFNDPDSLIVGTSNGVIRAIMQPSGTFNTNYFPTGCYYSITAIPNQPYFVTVKGGFPPGIHIESFTTDSLVPSFPVAVLPGSVHFSAPGNDDNHVYVLTSMGNQQSRLTSYSYVSGNIEMQTDIPGYPLDLRTSGDGMIYVLTYE